VAGEKRLKCPSCGTKFYLDTPAGESPANDPVSSPSMANLPTAGPSSSHSGPAVADDLILPNLGKDLRESFDLPLLSDDEPRSLPATPPPEVLLDPDPPPRSRKAAGAEARQSARRCSCGAVVPQGMSLCTRCGLDLDTGMRINVDELLEEPVALPPSLSAPMGVLFVGMITMLVSGVLGLASLYVYFSGRGGERPWGYLLLALICGFGIFASVKFLQGKSARLILTALLLGGAIDLVTMVILPIALPDEGHVLSIGQRPGRPDTPEIDLGPYAAEAEDLIQEEPLGPVIRPLTERIDWRKVYTGLIILLITSAVIVYLNSPPVRRYFERRRSTILPSMDGSNPFG
jgi:hypothetical protein